MLILDTTTALVQVITSSTADIDVNASYVDFTAPNTFTTDGQNTAIVTATTTTVVSSPGASIKRNVKGINIRNDHASTANTVTVEHTDGTTVLPLFKATLAAGECMVLNDAGVWFVYDANGGVKMGSTAASDTVAGLIKIATQAELEAPVSAVYALTPARAHFHPGMAKFWVQTTGGASQVIGVSYNVTSIADTATGRMTVTIATDFSSANWCCQVAVFMTATTGDEGIPNINAKAAGTVEVGCRIITPAFAEATVGYDVVGYGDQ